MVGLTERGSIHIDRLGLNRAPLVSRRLRLSLLDEALKERSALVDRISQLEDELISLETLVRGLDQ